MIDRGSGARFCGALMTLWLASLAASTVAGAQEKEPSDRLTLLQAVAMAQQSYPSVGAAQANQAAALAAVGRAKSKWWPSLAAQGNLVNYNEPMLVAPIHGFTQQDIQSIAFDNTLLQGNVGLAWTLFDGGGRVNRIRQARAEADGAAADLTAAEQGLTAQVTVAYLKVLSARGVLDAREQRIASLTAERRRVEQFLAEGQAAQVELLRVDAALAEAQAELVATSSRLDRAERELARLINVDPSQARVGRLAPVHLPAGSQLAERAELVERSAMNSPELERARQRVAMAEAGRRIARSSWVPRFDVQGGYQAYSSTAGDYSDLWSVGVGLNWQIFTGGERSQAVAQASAQEQAAREQLRLAQLGVEQDVDDDLSAALETGALVEALTRAVQHETEVVRIEQLSLQAGAGTQTDYLRAEADLSRGRSALVEAQHAEIAARVELARVVGDLTPEWLASNLEIGR